MRFDKLIGLYVLEDISDGLGGHTEVEKFVMSRYANVEELKQGRMRMLSIPSRNHRQFDPIELNCDLGSCTFTSAK